jgi:hypothetical protein
VYVWISSFLTILNVSGRNDIRAEFHVISSALSKEMGMMETQLKLWKDAALKTVALREKAHSLSEIEGVGYLHKLPFHFLSHLLCDWCFTEIYLNNLSL